MFNGSFFGGSDDFVFTSLYDGGAGSAFQYPVITPDGTGIFTGQDGSGSGHFRKFAPDGSYSIWTVVGEAVSSNAFDIDDSGTRVVSGTPTPLVDTGGYITIYTIPSTPGNAIVEQTIQAPTPQTGDLFGQSVAINGAGDKLFIAARDLLYYYTRSGTTWTRISNQALPVDAADDKRIILSMSSDGSTLVIGRPGFTIGSVADRGVAYIYYGTGGVTPSFQATINPSDNTTTSGLSFGFTTSISSDGNRVVITSNGVGIGDTYTYTRSGTTWSTGFKTSITEGKTAGAGISPDGNGMIVVNASTVTPVVVLYSWTGTSWYRSGTVNRTVQAGGQGNNSGTALANDFTFVVGPRVQMFRKTIV